MLRANGSPWGAPWRDPPVRLRARSCELGRAGAYGSAALRLSCSSILVTRQHAVDGRDERSPILHASLQLRAAVRRNGIYLPLSTLRPSLPLACNMTVALESVKRGVEGALPAAQHTVGASLDLPGDCIPVPGRVVQHRKHQRRQNEVSRVRDRLERIGRQHGEPGDFCQPLVMREV